MYQRPLVNLSRDRRATRVSEFGRLTAKLSGARLAALYREEKLLAPARHEVGKRYLNGHPGTVPSGGPTTRGEEHFAIALFNHALDTRHGLDLPGGGLLELLDYQVPLKARRSDQGVGKLDLLGLAPDERLAVVELKYMRSGNSSRADTPLRALLEGLAYCAILEANAPAVGGEVRETFRRAVSKQPPALIVAANPAYWDYYLSIRRGNGWTGELGRLGVEIESEIGVAVCFTSVGSREEPDWSYVAGRPVLRSEPLLAPAW